MSLGTRKQVPGGHEPTRGVIQGRIISDAREYYDYEHHKIVWGKPDGFEVIRKIGRGKYSEVFEVPQRARRGSGGGLDYVVIKILKPVRKGRSNAD